MEEKRYKQAASISFLFSEKFYCVYYRSFQKHATLRLRGLRSLGTALLLLSLMVESVLGGEYDLTVEVPPGKFQCFFQEVTEKHKAFEIDYQVIDGGDLNINFMLILGADIIKQDNMKTDATHRIELEKYGDYQICFDNSFSPEQAQDCDPQLGERRIGRERQRSTPKRSDDRSRAAELGCLRPLRNTLKKCIPSNMDKQRRSKQKLRG
ncbi:emp24/gp25L/p24 family/GOLD domain-containing protein [Ditylenchus destructor]|uniref:Emp24/gp25L/p24 family/GOLD domain-containing protein n=1 Tax=Ditylenchus destructor TaxID=166010 RepID=A0AAD4MW33_9BILA|nr:emp24/gp25L/p24 family/GOLD domain-containing protein [Ditylenchus destructor]